ncbi:serine/threonine-protein kinase [Streptomyces coffeae]|uniref:Serine/threonine-protein kinase n=1 Tax=Streptomyces coffeae TaxID=621382 RepID=A0ABS1NQX6_9ACTN|nr:serine/threonine-protein kinase [Streptomyces coffeae]MBL1102344.1 serine/threonine-protein kinase [Streptomyces coffeae]
MPHPLTHDDPPRIGPFELVARLGSGGMGTVYLARSPGGRTVALKTVHHRFASQPEFRTRFRLETDAARVIGGQYGAQVVDADPLADTPWLATAYVIGPPLDDAVALCGTLPEPAVRAIGAALCDALGQLHRSDVVHRDLKPSNILLTATGPKVIDFGIARAAGDDRLTRTGAAAGTPAYMSPEQATGGEHTAAGEVFALAGVLVFAATGRPPFGTGQPADLLYRVRYAEPELSAVPDGLRPVLERCLAKDPAQRPDMAELGSQLREGTGDVVDHLPDAVLADIARRGAAVWEVRPSRLPAPSTEDMSTVSDVSRTSRPARRRLLAAGGGLLVAGGAAAWGLLRDGGGEKATGSPHHGGAGSHHTGAPRLAWKTTGGAIIGDARLLRVGGGLAMVSESGLRCFDARTGKQRGVNDELVTDSTESTVVSDGHRLFALDPGASTLRIVPVDFATGTVRSPLATLRGIAADDARFLAATDSALIVEGKARRGWVRAAVDPGTGQEMWRRRIATPGDDEIVATPVETTGLIRTQGEQVTLIDVRNGAPRWTAKVPEKLTGGLSVGARHTFSAGLLFLGTWELMALRLSDGKRAWSFGAGRDLGTRDNKPGVQRYGPPVVQGGVVYSAERERGLVALDAASGRLKWDLKKGDGPVLAFAAIPAADDAYVYVSPDNDSQWAAAVDRRTHRVVWTFQSPLADRGGAFPRIMTHPAAKRLIIGRGDAVCALPLP